MFLHPPPIAHKGEGTPEKRPLFRTFRRPKYLGQAFQHSPCNEHGIWVRTKHQERIGVLALLDSKGRQHEAQVTAPSNVDRERPPRQCDKGTKVFLEIYEISPRSVLWFHTGTATVYWERCLPSYRLQGSGARLIRP